MPAVRRPTVRVLATALAVMAAGIVAVLPRLEVVEGPLFTTDELTAAVGLAALLAAIATGVCLLVLGRVATAWHNDGFALCAALVCLAGIVVLGWEGGPDQVRMAGGVVAPLLGVALLAPMSRRVLRRQRMAASAAAVLGGLSLVVFAVRDPFRDPGCWYDCSVQSSSPLSSRQAARVLAPTLVAAGWAVAVAAAALAVMAMVNSVRRSSPKVWLDLGVVCTAAVAAVGATGLQHLSERGRAWPPPWMIAAGLIALGVCTVLQPALALLRRRQVRALALALGEMPPLGTLESALAHALSDREVRVAYWLPASRIHVDATGNVVEGAAEWPVKLHRGGEPLAAVWLGTRDRDEHDLEDLVGSSARLAIDSERMQAEHQAQLRDLQASQRRIVATADATRRRVERSIHDVVQAELLAALYDVALVHNRAARADQAAAAREMTELADGIRTLVTRVRDFAHGIYPAVLDASGLSAALDALADDAPVALTIHHNVGRRAPIEVERAVYLLVRDAVTRAVNDFSILLADADTEMHLTVDPYTESVPEHLADRVGALGGTIGVDAGVMRAVLPCA